MESIKCKVCHEEKLKETSYTKKVKQVTCDDCLEKAKSHRATSALNRIVALERENEELKQKLEKELKDKQYYQGKFEDFAEKYSDLCIKVENLTLHKK
jgi:hypothetical protein